MQERAMPLSPEEQAVWLDDQPPRSWGRPRPRQTVPDNLWSFLSGFLPYALALKVMEWADVPFWALWPLAVFGALLPLGMISRFGTWAVKVMCERRARRSLRPRPRAAYLVMALGWALAGGTCALLAWRAGARSVTPGADGEDWIAAWLAWAALISACAALMMLCRAPTAGGPAAIGRRRGQLLG